MDFDEISKVINTKEESRHKPVCKHCGCTDGRACIQKYDEPCYWVIIDGKDSVCSACHDELMLKQQDKCGDLDIPDGDTI